MTTIVTVIIIEGRSDAQKSNLQRQVADAIRRALGRPDEAVHIAIDEVPAHHFALAGVAKQGPSSTSAA